MTEASLEERARAAQAGDSDALREVLAAVQPLVLRLARRVLGPSPEAEDAAQEILVRVLTHLGTFRGEAQLTTWVYTLATRDLFARLRARQRDRAGLVELGRRLRAPLEATPAGLSPTEARALEEEVFEGCTRAMLDALDGDLRAAFVLGAVCELSHRDGAAVLGGTPAAFRQRLRRARGKLRAFLSAHCGWANDDAPCRCSGRVARNLREGKLDLAALRRRPPAVPGPVLARRVRQVGALKDATQLFRASRERPPPPRLVAALERALQALRSPLSSG